MKSKLFFAAMLVVLSASAVFSQPYQEFTLSGPGELALNHDPEPWEHKSVIFNQQFDLTVGAEIRIDSLCFFYIDYGGESPCPADTSLGFDGSYIKFGLTSADTVGLNPINSIWLETYSVNSYNFEYKFRLEGHQNDNLGNQVNGVNPVFQYGTSMAPHPGLTNSLKPKA